MLEEGLLPILNSLIFSENIQLQTKALAVIQYFDGFEKLNFQILIFYRNISRQINFFWNNKNIIKFNKYI